MASRERATLVFSTPPTPNGRLHLGHASGPYLLADVMRNSVKRDDGRVVFATGVDPYETHVAKIAHERKVSPQDIARKNTKEIIEDLRTLDVDIDIFLNPLDEAKLDFELEVCSFFDTLSANGVIDKVTEQWPWSNLLNEFVPPSHISGSCPRCDNTAGATTCEECSFHYRPEQLNDPSVAMEGDIQWKPTTSLFWNLPSTADILKVAKTSGLTRSQIDTIDDFLRDSVGRIRLTQPSRYGIATRHLDSSKGRSYSSICLTPFLMLARKKALLLTQHDSLSIVRAFGSDGLIHNTVGPISYGILLGIDFGNVVTNEFLLLSDSKFSTSRDHAVWLSEFSDKPSFKRNALRFFLAIKSPRFTRVDYTTAAFESFFHKLSQRLIQVVVSAESENNITICLDFEKQLKEQEKLLLRPQFDPISAAEIAYYWLFTSKDRTPYSILAGFCYLAIPFMPAISRLEILERSPITVQHPDLKISNEFLLKLREWIKE